MTPTQTSGGFKALRFAGLVALAGLGVAAFLIVGSYLFWQVEKKSGATSESSLRELRGRLETIKREREDMRGTEETYRGLIARGAFAPERRLDFIEAMDQLKSRHKLISLEYEVAPQRPLKFATGGSYSAVNILASRIKLKIQAYHDGEMLAFLDEFPRIGRGFFPIDQCTIKRTAEYGQAPTGGTANPPGGPVPATGNTPVQSTESGIVAECTLEWITLVDRHKPAAPQAGLPIGARKPI